MHTDKKPWSGHDDPRRMHNLDSSEKDIILCLMQASSPVSIDTLSNISGTPAVRVLNVMEKLRREGIVHEKKELGKGVYFFTSSDITNYAQTKLVLQGEVKEEILENLIKLHEQSAGNDEEKVLVLANLYMKLGRGIDGINHIIKAAEIHSNSGKQEAALTCYDYVLRCFDKVRATNDNISYFLDSTLGKIAIAGHLMASQEKESILNRAKEAAKRLKKREALAEIELALGEAHQQKGDYKKAHQCMKSYRELAREIGNQKMIKRAELMMVEFLHWEGKEYEVIRRYESVIGGLEEFENDEVTLKATARVGLCYVLCGRIARGFGIIDSVRAKAAALDLRGVSIFCDFITILVLFEIRRIDESLPYIERISSLPDEVLGHYILRALFAFKAYVCCTKGEYEKSFENLKKVIEHSRLVGWIYHKGPWNFEYLNILEKFGFYHEEMNYDGEIERSINWNDVYMKGVAYRYRAQKSMEQHKPLVKVLADLKNSEKYLKQSGVEIQLAYTRAVLGDLYLKKGEGELGQSYLKAAWFVLSKIDKALFPKDLLAIIPQEHMIEVMADRIISINESLSTAHEMSSFLEKVVDLAMDFTMATRGAFVAMESDEPAIVASRNLDPLMIKPEQLAFIKNTTSAAKLKGIEAYIPGSEKMGDIPDKYFLKTGVNSFVCVPVRLAEKEFGYLYLDNRVADTPFPDRSLFYLRLLCNQIAVGISNVKLYEEMKALKDRFENEATFYKREFGATHTVDTIIGQSGGVKRIIDQIHQVAPTNSTVLILGETGVGKELVAKAIHNLSNRKNNPFIPVNLAALPPELVASELFGHEKGAYTGANEARKGRFELAHGGTIFLDEIGDLPLSIQVTLLRVLQEGKFERLGGSKPVYSDFRVIAATHKNLNAQVEDGAFRQDLYYRLNVFPILVPPLRERREDIPLFVNHFLSLFGKKHGKLMRQVSLKELKKLESYHWPGNVRELEHFIERSVILSGDGNVSFSGFEHVPPETPKIDNSSITTLNEMERKHIEKALDATRGRVCGPQGAASLLGLKPTTLFFRMKKLGINKYRPFNE